MFKSILTVATAVVASFISFSAPASAGVKEMTSELQRLGVKVEISPFACADYGWDFRSVPGVYMFEKEVLCVSTSLLPERPDTEDLTLEGVLTHESVHVVQHRRGSAIKGWSVQEQQRRKMAKELGHYNKGCQTLSAEAVAWTEMKNPEKILQELKELPSNGENIPEMEWETSPECVKKQTGDVRGFLEIIVTFGALLTSPMWICWIIER